MSVEIVEFAEATLLDALRKECSVWVWKNVTVVVWRAQATIAAVARLSEVTRAFVEEHPEGFSNVHIVATGLKTPTAEARAGLERLTRAVGPRLACVAMVLEGQGFWAHAIRTSSVAIRLVTKGTYAHRMHSSVASVARWLPEEHRRRTGVHLDPSELTHVLEGARVAGFAAR